MQAVKEFLLSKGVPPDVIAKLDALEGHAKEILWMVVADGKAAAVAFIENEYAKVAAAVKAA